MEKHNINLHKKNAIKHIIKRFEERFAHTDFEVISSKWGIVSYTKDVALSIVNARKNAEYTHTCVKLIGHGRDYCDLYRVWIGGKTKKVYVVWNTFLDLPITVLTSDMVYTNRKLNANWAREGDMQAG